MNQNVGNITQKKPISTWYQNPNSLIIYDQEFEEVGTPWALEYLTQESTFVLNLMEMGDNTIFSFEEEESPQDDEEIVQQHNIVQIREKWNKEKGKAQVGNRTKYQRETKIQMNVPQENTLPSKEKNRVPWGWIKI